MKSLPPGQKEIHTFPRFGLPKYATRFPSETEEIKITIAGEVDELTVSEELMELPFVTQTADFHCVTTWSKLNLAWGGYRFIDFYEKFIPQEKAKSIVFAVIKGQDGYKTSLPIQDLLNLNVLLATQLDNKPLGIEHGCPVRLVVPDHYGYKNIKHLYCLEFYSTMKKIKKGFLSFMDHNRARVRFEERAKSGPQLFFRYLYRRSIHSTIKKFEKATKDFHLRRQKKLKGNQVV